MDTLFRLCLVAALGMFVVSAAACGDDSDGAGTGTGDGGAGDNGSAASLEEVCAAGIDEGSFTYWATYEDENWQQVADAFAEAYPGIAVDFLSLRDEETTQRILTSVSAGQSPDPDLISNDLASQAPLVERDVIDTEVDWTELGVDEDLISGTNAIRTYLVGLGLAYNTETTDPEDLPDTWEELIDDQFAQDVIVDPRGRPFGFFGLAWDEEQTLDYAQRLNDIVQPILIEGGTAGMTAVLTGEATVSTGGRADSALELQASGAPIEIKYLDLVPTEADYNALIADAGSPNAAKCFAGWQATAEGAEVFESVEFKENLDVPTGAPADATILLVETPEEADLTSQLFQEIASIFVAS